MYVSVQEKSITVRLAHDDTDVLTYDITDVVTYVLTVRLFYSNLCVGILVFLVLRVFSSALALGF